MSVSIINTVKKIMITIIITTLFVGASVPVISEAVELSEEQRNEFIELLKIELAKIIAEKLSQKSVEQKTRDYSGFERRKFSVEDGELKLKRNNREEDPIVDEAWSIIRGGNE